MKPGILLALACAILPAGCETAGDYGRVMSGLGLPAGGPVTAAEIDAGLREALTLGTNNVAGRLGRTDGYFGDPRVRIPLPRTYRDIQTNLARIGASGPLDDLELRVNRAAEAAMPEVRTLVVNAVRQITIEDAVRILNGGDTAATDYLRARTETSLRAAFTPHARDALARSGAFTALETIASQHGFGGATQSLQADLTANAVQFGLDGLFLYVAEEEKNIRENPLARTTELLRRVFGARV